MKFLCLLLFVFFNVADVSGQWSHHPTRELHISHDSHFITASGQDTLNVDGSGTEVIFSINSHPIYDKKIEFIEFEFHDEFMKLSGMESQRFGSAATAPGLTVGLNIWTVEGTDTVAYHTENLKFIGRFYEWTGTSVHLINDVDGISAGVDLLIAVVNIHGSYYLRAGTTDALIVKVQDDLSALNYFTVEALTYLIKTR